MQLPNLKLYGVYMKIESEIYNVTKEKKEKINYFHSFHQDYRNNNMKFSKMNFQRKSKGYQAFLCGKNGEPLENKKVEVVRQTYPEDITFQEGYDFYKSEEQENSDSFRTYITLTTNQDGIIDLGFLEDVDFIKLTCKEIDIRE